LLNWLNYAFSLTPIKPALKRNSKARYTGIAYHTDSGKEITLPASSSGNRRKDIHFIAV
jgi:hypothetical protein